MPTDSVLRFLSLAFLQESCLLNVGLEHSRFDLVFEQHRLCNNNIFGMLYWIVEMSEIHLSLTEVFLTLSSLIRIVEEATCYQRPSDMHFNQKLSLKLDLVNCMSNVLR